MNRREFLKKGLEGIVVGSIPLISCSWKNPANSELGRIIPFKSIDGVYLGDTIDTVEKKLGEPDGGFTWDGPYGGGQAYEYNKGFHAGLEVCFMGYDYVDSLIVRAPYSGTTKEGIGIGSSLVSVHNFYGMPDKSHSYSNFRGESYYSNYAVFSITYKDNYIIYFRLGFVHEK